LQAFVVAISQYLAQDDKAEYILKARSPDDIKSLRSWEILFNPIGSHKAYRQAMEFSTPACIPATYVFPSAT
jgi:hypothetical protein